MVHTLSRLNGAMTINFSHVVFASIILPPHLVSWFDNVSTARFVKREKKNTIGTTVRTVDYFDNCVYLFSAREIRELMVPRNKRFPLGEWTTVSVMKNLPLKVDLLQLR